MVFLAVPLTKTRIFGLKTQFLEPKKQFSKNNNNSWSKRVTGDDVYNTT